MTNIRRITRKLPVIALIVTGLWSTVFAQNAGKVSGVVREAQSKESMPSANVVIIGTTLGASTNMEGSYFILNVPPGQYEIQASVIGYQKVIVQGVIVHAGRTTIVDFDLPEQIIEMREVVVQAVRPDVEKEKTSTSEIVRFDEVQALPGVRNVGDIIALAADVVDGHFRGGRLGEEYYTLQGMGIVNPLDNSSAFLPIMSGVEEVEVITSGFGAQYGNAQSGVVNISMREGKSDRWQTRVETRTRPPGRKHFGPSVYDPTANPYLALLLSGDAWLSGDPGADTPQPYYGSMGSGLTSSYARDTLVQLAVAQQLWRQTRRDLNNPYGRDVDYSIEAGTGGPIGENLRMFIALRSRKEWPVFPTEQPDVE